MKPSQRILDRAKQNGTIDRAARILAAAYLLSSEANNLIDEAAELLERNGLMLGYLKHLQNQFATSASRYFIDYCRLADKSRDPMDYFNDLSEFSRRFRAWAKLDEPQQGKEARP